MVEPTPFAAFRDRVGSKASEADSGISVQDFTDKFEEHFFEILGLELSDSGESHASEPAENTENEKKYDAGDINFAIADGCHTYAMQKIAALSSHFTSDTTENEINMLANVNDFTKAGETAYDRDLTQKEVSDLLHQCLVKTSIELFKTNIFSAPTRQI